MKIGVIGDDFTGSSDIANTLAKAGARTVQYVGIPTRHAPDDIDAAVISLKSRTIPVNAAVEQAVTACRWLTENGAEQLVFKYCSTFDSTPSGNIGPVAEALLAELDAPLAVICPAFPANGRTVFQGHLFVGDRLLNESGMEHHPLTPMTDPDIRRWVSRQTQLQIGHLPLNELRDGAKEALSKRRHDGDRLVVTDAVDDNDLILLGRALNGCRLVTGGSGIAMGLPANFGITPNPAATGFSPVQGPGIVLSGSCSDTTRKQIAYYSRRHPSFKVTTAHVLDLPLALMKAISFIKENLDKAPLIYSATDPLAVSEAQSKYGIERLALSFERFFSELAIEAMGIGFRRIVCAGGETSGAIIVALCSGALEIGPEIAPGVPALSTQDNVRLGFALKSGNFGQTDFFERALIALKQEKY